MLGNWQVSTAAQNGVNKPLTLYDANNTFLGTIVGVDTSLFGSDVVYYTTYYEPVDGILSFVSGGDGATGFSASLAGPMLFTQLGCSGDVYVESPVFADPQIVSYRSGAGLNGYYKGSNEPVTSITALSSQSGDTCQDLDVPSERTVYRLVSVTLPDEFSTLEWPLTIVSR